MFFTIGHGTRTVDALIAELRGAGARSLVDVRRFPRSRTNPQFNAEDFARALADDGIRYRHDPALGGRRGRVEGASDENAGWEVEAFRNYADYTATSPFVAAFARLLRERGPTAVMCAEAVWWRCHRRLIADQLLAAGADVFHLLPGGRVEPAFLTPFAQVRGGRLVYPAGGAADSHLAP